MCMVVHSKLLSYILPKDILPLAILTNLFFYKFSKFKFSFVSSQCDCTFLVTVYFRYLYRLHIMVPNIIIPFLDLPIVILANCTIDLQLSRPRTFHGPDESVNAVVRAAVWSAAAVGGAMRERGIGSHVATSA